MRLLTCEIHPRGIYKIIPIVKMMKGDLWCRSGNMQSQEISKHMHELNMLK